MFNKIIWQKHLCVLSMLCVWVLGRDVKNSKSNLYRGHAFHDNLFGITRIPLDGLHEMLYYRIFSKSVDRIQGSLKYEKNNQCLTWWPIYMFIVSCWMLLRMRKLSYKVVEKIKPHVSRLMNFSKNRAIYVIMWKIMLSQTGHIAVCMLDNWGDTRTRIM